jgi:uncharacterized protein (DUF2147 family)
MTRKITAMFVFLLFSLVALANNPDAILGVWKNGEGTGLVQIYKKGDKFYGKIVWLKVANNPDGTPRTDENNPDEKLKTRTLKGMENIRDVKYMGENRWEEGQVYDPKTGNDYRCEMKLVDENTLEVRGFIGISLFGRTDVWKRQIKK